MAFSPAEAKKLWDRFELVYTPKHGSCLNVAEIELNVLFHQCLKRRMDHIDKVTEEVNEWQRLRLIQVLPNRIPAPSGLSGCFPDTFSLI